LSLHARAMASPSRFGGRRVATHRCWIALSRPTRATAQFLAMPMYQALGRDRSTASRPQARALRVERAASLKRSGILQRPPRLASLAGQTHTSCNPSCKGRATGAAAWRRVATRRAPAAIAQRGNIIIGPKLQQKLQCRLHALLQRRFRRRRRRLFTFNGRCLPPKFFTLGFCIPHWSHAFPGCRS